MACFRLRVWRTRKLAVAALAGTGIAVLIGALAAGPAAAKSGRESKREEATYLRPDGRPVMAIVAIDQQRITVYDADGPMLRSPVSTGKRGYETPPGIYTVLQKKVRHYSNIYYDAAMPYMQRITWSGIALHAGVLPGYPASGGCIRMPMGFAERLYERTRLGMRVIVVRDDISPAGIVHPALFKPSPEEAAPVTAVSSPTSVAGSETKSPASIVDAPVGTAPATPRQSLRSLAAAKAAAAADASRKADEARRAAVKAKADAKRLARALRRAEAAEERAEAQSRRAERRAAAIDPGTPAGERAQEAKAAALAEFAEAKAKLDAVKAQAESAQELLARSREEAKAAVAAKTAALEEAEEAQRKLAPISVLVSRKTQRLYVRQAREPLFESDVTIADADSPLGTYVFSALEYAKAKTELRWNVVSMYRDARAPEPETKGKRRSADRHAAAAGTDLAGARLALDRIAIPKEAIDRISEIISPGSSLIVSDEGISTETGKYTDFIVVMSNEPAGGLRIRRRRNPEVRYRSRRPHYRSPYVWSGPSYWFQ